MPKKGELGYLPKSLLNAIEKGYMTSDQAFDKYAEEQRSHVSKRRRKSKSSRKSARKSRKGRGKYISKSKKDLVMKILKKQGHGHPADYNDWDLPELRQKLESLDKRKTATRVVKRKVKQE
jgi:hypothetical protein